MNPPAALPIFVISLARAAERRANIARQLGAAGVDYEIVDAVDGAALDLSALGGRLRQDKAKKLLDRELMPGEIGCYLSHYSLWERIAKQPQNCALVLEDDVEFANDFFAVVGDIVNSPWHWEVVNLASVNQQPIVKNLHAVGGGRQFGLSIRAKVLTSAYLIRPSGAQKLLEYCREICEPIDELYVRWWRHGAAYYYVSPPAAKQAEQELPSGIGVRRKRRGIATRIIFSIRRKRERLARWRAVLRHRPLRKEHVSASAEN